MADLAVKFGFVPLGAQAPDPLPPGEIWVDVGNRADRAVIDQHGGTSGVWSSAELVLRRFDEGTLPAPGEADSWTIVVHTHPDLDAVCAAWLTRHVLQTGALPVPREALEILIDQVGLHDQGFVAAEPPERNWSLVLRALLDPERTGADDRSVLEAGLRAVEETFRILAAGGSLEQAALSLCDRPARQAMLQAERDYEEDRARGIVFQVRLPVRPLDRDTPVPESGLAPVPSHEEARWSLADGLFLHDPASRLFKELARTDRDHSPLGRGFSLLVVSWSTGGSSAGRPLKRYVVSTDPATGLHVQGLGLLLEEREERLEGEVSLPALGGRERVSPGAGRHGASVASPWYDGRGHRYTIVDSPSVLLGGRSLCASRLTSAEVLETVWAFGDPARFAKVEEAELAVFCPVSRDGAQDCTWRETTSLSDYCSDQDLCPEVLYSLGGGGRASGLLIHHREAVSLDEPLPWKVKGHQLWVFPDGTSIAVVLYSYFHENKSLRDLAADVQNQLSRPIASWLPVGLKPSTLVRPQHSLHCRIHPSSVNLEDGGGPSSRMLHNLALGQSSRFSTVTDKIDLERTRRLLARDHRFLLLATEFGSVSVSTRSSRLSEEKGAFRPDKARLLYCLVLGYRTSLSRIGTAFARHRSIGDMADMGSHILKDSEELMAVEQVLSFSRITDHPFGHDAYGAWTDLLNVKSLLLDTRSKIGILAGHVRQVQSRFYQRLTFWVSFLFAPLALTAAMFSGIHMDRHFGGQYLGFCPPSWPAGGWLMFFAIFVFLSAFCGLIWFLVQRKSRRDGILRKMLRHRDTR